MLSVSGTVNSSSQPWASSTRETQDSLAPLSSIAEATCQRDAEGPRIQELILFVKHTVLKALLMASKLVYIEGEARSHKDKTYVQQVTATILNARLRQASGVEV